MGFIEISEEEVEDLKSRPKPHNPGHASLRIKDLEIRDNKSNTSSYVQFTINVESLDGIAPDSSGVIFHSCSFKSNALWNLNNLATACGVNEDKRFLNRLVEAGKTNEVPKVESFLKEAFIGASFQDEITLTIYDKNEQQETKLDSVALLTKYEQDEERYRPGNKLAGKYKRS